VPQQYAFQKAAIKRLIPNAAEPLYSPTDSKKSKLSAPSWTTPARASCRAACPQEWDRAMKNWRKEAGDQMRREFEQAWEIRRS